ncbi:MAG: NAD(P)/FAD-dependent oxidoreductase [Candidatus Loosdrechtia sp.]|uniref:NAD(P)/FAD-dependent oxidoreductase n=1 Tax=Candidatus Loosdrechtia sp. TaxID=3101272 RepID=UPI003A6A0E0D|nr:MAG: NAD(P)/FAD-dependent oxidoreductase [Candidatus Jettenia sp. AMX2]
MPGHFDCIVLGAGIAGITAAAELKNAGKRVLLLEATNRAGGRISSKEDFVLADDGSTVRKGFPIEEGAHFIHVDEDPYKEFWVKLKQFQFKTEKYSKFNKVRIAFPGDPDPEWRLPNPASWTYTYDSSLQKMGSKNSGLFGQIKRFDTSNGDQSAKEFVQSLGYQKKSLDMAFYAISAHTPGILTLEGTPEKLTPPNHSGDASCISVADNISVAGLMFDNIPEQLREEMAEYKMLGPKKERCGFEQLPKAIVREFEREEPGTIKGKVLYEHEVAKVEKSGYGVRVKTSNGAEFTADAAICTFSVGMLLHHGFRGNRILEQFFPNEKKKVFEIIKPGPIAKFSIQFKECVWGYDHLVNDNHMAILVNPTGHKQKENPQPRTFFTSFPNLEKGPYVLTALMMGIDYLIIKKFTHNKDAAEYIFKRIEEIYNMKDKWDWKKKLVWKNAHEPNVHCKDWGMDRWSRCGNSYICYQKGKSIQEIKNVREELKNPVETLPVFWAGEATAPAYNNKYQPLSVHGAYISGVEAAKDVMVYLEKQGDKASFEKYYHEKYRKISAKKVMVTMPYTITPKLNECEIAVIKKYANKHTNGDINLAVEDLLDFAIREIG